MILDAMVREADLVGVAARLSSIELSVSMLDPFVSLETNTYKFNCVSGLRYPVPGHSLSRSAIHSIGSAFR